MLVPRPHLDALQAREAEWPTGTSHRKLNPGTTRRVQSGAQRSDPRQMSALPLFLWEVEGQREHKPQTRQNPEREAQGPVSLFLWVPLRGPSRSLHHTKVRWTMTRKTLEIWAQPVSCRDTRTGQGSPSVTAHRQPLGRDYCASASPGSTALIRRAACVAVRMFAYIGVGM